MKTLKEMIAPNKHPVIQAIQRANQSKKYERADLAPEKVPGVKRLGSGAYGSVYKKDEGSVVKVYHDPAYHQFVKYAKANQDDPHMPKIHSSGRIKGTPYHYVKMENLEPFTKSRRGYDEITHIHHDTFGDPSDMKTELHFGENGKALKEKVPTLHKSLDKLVNHFKHGQFDLHGSNMMMRPSTGHVVITDPIVDSGPSEGSKNNHLYEMISLNRHPNLKRAVDRIDPTDTINSHRIRDNLYSAGVHTSPRFRELGSGAFATTLHDKKSNNVVKIHGDAAYNSFVKHARANQDDPHLPKIHAAGKIKGTNYHYVKMEKLVDAKEYFGHDKINQLTRSLKIYKGAKYQDHDIKYGHQLHHMLNNSDQGNSIKQAYPGLHKTLSDFAEKHPNHRLDLHGGNFMARPSTGHLVLTDPVVSWTQGMSKEPGGSQAVRLSKLSKDPNPPKIRLGGSKDRTTPPALSLTKHTDGWGLRPTLKSKSRSSSSSSVNWLTSNISEMIAPNRFKPIQTLQSDDSEEARYMKDRRVNPEHQLGSGVGGTAFNRSKNNTVIKVYHDTGYHEFAKYAKKNQNDPHMPKIYAHGRIKDSPYAAVRMEKLKKLDDKHPLYKHISASYQRPGPNGTLYSLNHLKDYDPEHNPEHEAFHDRFPSVSLSLLRMKEKFPHHSLDFHSGNVMQRDDGTPVITDPLMPDDSIGRAKTHMKEDAPTNSAGGGHIAGIGIGPQGEPGRPGPMLRRSKFAGQEVFEVKSDVFHQARMSKQKHLHWKSYIGEDETGAAIREFANKNPKKAIILKDERTGAMHYARFGTK